MTLPDLTGWTIVFDLDGTLVDSAPDLHAALNHSLEDAGYTGVPFSEIAGMIGSGAKAMIRKGLAYQGAEVSEDIVAPLFDSFIGYYSRNLCNLSRLYPDAMNTLAGLRQSGATLAVCTNKTQSLSEAVLQGFGISSSFSAIVGADVVPSKKPDGDHILRTIERAGGNSEYAIMIGDSQTDERAARNAGLPFIFFPFGYGPEPDEDNGKITRCESYVDLPSLISMLTV